MPDVFIAMFLAVYVQEPIRLNML